MEVATELRSRLWVRKRSAAEDDEQVVADSFLFSLLRFIGISRSRLARDLDKDGWAHRGRAFEKGHEQRRLCGREETRIDAAQDRNRFHAGDDVLWVKYEYDSFAKRSREGRTHNRAAVCDKRIDQVFHDVPQAIQRCSCFLLRVLRHYESQSFFNWDDSALIASDDVENNVAEVGRALSA